MEDKTFLETYDGQSVDELIALEETHRLDSIVLAFEAALYQKRARLGDDSINEVEWAILAVESLEREVNNGGFDQFFTNPSYEFVPSIVEILEKISCPNFAVITKKAIDALGLQKYDFDSIDERVNGDDSVLKTTLARCDEQFYEYPDDVESRLFSYVKENRENIRFS
jgi:hypothetical protein